MNRLIEDYGIVGDLHTVALVSRFGSIDWLCLPRFDSGACFAALVDEDDAGFWRIGPKGAPPAVSRSYVKDSLVLETVFTGDFGSFKVTDFMPPRTDNPTIIRIVEGLSDLSSVEMELCVRFDYGQTVPWVKRTGDGINMIAGPHGLSLESPVHLQGRSMRTYANFTIEAGEEVAFTLTYHNSLQPAPSGYDPAIALENTLEYWQNWALRCQDHFGEYQDVVMRSLITLKSLIYSPTGGIVAAPTTSLPEEIGGERNWDYRYCWLRDATFTLYALMVDGYADEARRWRDWLLRAAAGAPEQLQIMYGVAGERLIPEFELDWLTGFEGSKPVRVGNAASDQFQLDVYGELLDAFYQFRRSGIAAVDDAWDLELRVVEFVENNWRNPDEGIWEVRGPRRDFTYSKVMSWVALDRAVRVVERFGFDGPVERWKAEKDIIRNEVLQKGFNPEVGAFTQYFGSTALDASVLLLPLVGFIDVNDPRMLSTVEQIDKTLSVDGLLRRYSDEEEWVDGLKGSEGAFLACSFWLVDNLALMGRYEEAKERFDHLLTLGNDLMLFSEEYDSRSKRMLGNFPQAFTHVGIVNTARNVLKSSSPAMHRSTHNGHFRSGPT